MTDSNEADPIGTLRTEVPEGQVFVVAVAPGDWTIQRIACSDCGRAANRFEDIEHWSNCRYA